VPRTRFFGRVSAYSLSKSSHIFSTNNLGVKISFSGKTVMLPIPDREKETEIINFFAPIDDRTQVSRSTFTPLHCPET
jgi:hypothetical protein